MTGVKLTLTSVVCCFAVLLLVAATPAAGTPTYIGHSRPANVVLAVVARKPGVTAWALSFKFTPAGTPLLRKVKALVHPYGTTTDPSAFCISGQRLWQAFLGPSDLRKDGLRVARFINLPTPKRWVCGLHDDRPAKHLKAFVANALLVVTLVRGG